jgi:DNA-binding protein HU-beta
LFCGALRRPASICSVCNFKAGKGANGPENGLISRIFRLTRQNFGRWFRSLPCPQHPDNGRCSRSGGPAGCTFLSKGRIEMSKKDLIDAVAIAAELSKEKASVAVDAMINHIEKTMKNGEEVRIPGFGTFKVANRAARKARNPQTGVEMMLKASRVPKFTASKNLREMLN